MPRSQLVRHARLLILLLPISAAIAQPPPRPLPLGPPPQPPGNVVTLAKANLGKALFWDEQLSTNRTVACGTCHEAASGGSDRRSRLQVTGSTNPGADGALGSADDILGSPGVILCEADGSLQWSSAFGFSPQVTGRRAPSYINAAYSPELFWDGRAGRAFTDPLTGDTLLFNGGALENQSAGPPVSSAEMGHIGRDWNDVAARVAASSPLALAVFVPGDLSAWIGDRTYPQLFAEAFGTPNVTPARIAMAIASYERTQFANQTPFDSSLAGTAALTPIENAGQQLFGALPCARCHAGSLMSDNAYHYIGVRPAAEDSGRVVVTHNLPDLGAFRTPSVRNVALRPSFMHDGRLHTLEEVVDFYDRGGDFNAPNKSPLIAPLNLNPQQKAQLLAFLRRPLTDTRVAAATAPFDRPALYGESGLAPKLTGAGVVGTGGTIPQAVALEPPITGNPSFTVGLFGALGGAEAVLVIDESAPPLGAGIPASGSFARVSIRLGGSGATDGRGSATLAIPNDPALHGKRLYGRWYVADSGAPDGVAASSLIEMQVFGPRGAGVTVLGIGSPVSVGSPAVRFYGSQPNPFAAKTAARFDLFKASRVRLMVYDIAGRAVRRLVDDPLRMPGSYAVSWDGRDQSGRAMPGGVYFLRLEAGGGAQSARVVRTE